MGPYHGSVTDLTILRASHVLEQFPENLKFLADRIYYSHDELQNVYIGFRQPLTEEIQRDFNRSLASERVLIENVLGRLKAYIRPQWKTHGVEQQRNI